MEQRDFTKQRKERLQRNYVIRMVLNYAVYLNYQLQTSWIYNLLHITSVSLSYDPKLSPFLHA